jgi:hypothetical protein
MTPERRVQHSFTMKMRPIAHPLAVLAAAPCTGGITIMARIARTLAALGLSGALAVTAFAPAAQADHLYRDVDGYRIYEHHDDWHPRRVHRVRRHRDNNVGAAIALGAGALILGAIIADSANRQPRRVYRDYEEPRVVRHQYRGGALEPWSAEWYDWCDDRYRSFNPRTGTYRGYDGRDHFCDAY